jgi:FKBP-type peptidyl-prolyl cis-trans isomerase
METDSGLVDHVRGYFENGGKPAQSMQEKLGLDEDFVYDETEALTDPNSDSAKLKDAYTQQLVDQKVNTILQQKEQQNAQNAQQQRMKVEAEEFKTKNNMTDEQFNAMMEASKNRRMTLDDIHYLVNKDTTTANVAKSTKQDMMNQMKNVRDIPTSVGGINSPRAEKSSSDQVFDALLGSDGDIDNLFG